MSGHLPIRLDGTMVTGAIGPGGRSLEDGQGPRAGAVST